MKSPSVLKPITTCPSVSPQSFKTRSNERIFQEKGAEKDLGNISPNYQPTSRREVTDYLHYLYAEKTKKGNESRGRGELQNSRVASGLILWGHIDPDNDT